MSKHQLSANVDELFDLVRKSQGIISTHSAGDLEDSPGSVEEKYRGFAETHISLGDTSGFEERVYRSLVEDEKPTKGYLYGPFGYGKTSTSVSIWHTLSQNDVIAVPPFTVTSFSGIMRATYGWLQYELENKAPSYVDRLEEIYDDYLQQELRAYARQQEGNHDLEFDKLVAMFEDMEQKGELDLSINADTLIDFFNECTELVLDADFDGLVVIGDELQQYFKKADNRRDAEVRFRELVFGLQSGAKIQDEFGFFVSMPDQTKSNLDTQAGDVLNRLESDNLMLNLRTVYGQDFPAELWARYADRFNFKNKQYDVIGEYALNAIGQICSRDDLSNGPRTVIDIYRIALQQHQNSGNRFTALDLADAFYEGEVRYQGNSTIIQSAIGDALDHSSVDTNPKEQFIKLCAVFPEEGIPEEVVEDYDLGDAKLALSKKLHGEVIKVIADGYTLIDVTRREGPQDIVRQLIRDFWSQYDFDHVNAQFAIKALSNKLVCGEIFESTRGELRGWNVGDGLDQIDQTTYRKRRIEGTFNARYPKRMTSLSVTDAEHQDDVIGQYETGQNPENIDIGFNFVLGWEHGGEKTVNPHIHKESPREFTFIMNGRQGFDELPDGIEFLRDAMDPNAVTPFLMLALVQYLEEDDTELDAQQESRIQSFQQSLLDQAVKTLFNETLINNAPFNIRRAGKRTVEQVFTEAMKGLYPDYRTLIGSTMFRDMMRDYMDFLDSLRTTSLRRGTDTLQEAKSAVAERFNLRNTSSFKGRINKHYSDILVVENPDANNYEVRAKLHPFEQLIVDNLESGDREELPLDEVEEIGFEKGYLDEELKILYALLQRRNIVGLNRNDALVLLETDYSIADVEEVVEKCRKYLDTIENLDEDQIPKGASGALMEVETFLESTNPDDGERLEELYVHTQSLIRDLERKVEILHSRYKTRCEDHSEQANRKSRKLVPDHLQDTIEGGVQFVGGLNDARSELLAKYHDLKGDLNELGDDLDSAIEEYDEATLENAVILNEKQSEAAAQLQQIEDKEEDFEDHSESLKEWQTFTSRVANVKGDIMNYARTFDESIEEEEDITKFIGDVSERLADDPIAALDNLDGFVENLNRIEKRYKHRRKERRDVFDEKRESLKAILDEATDGTSTGLRTAGFDIRNPEESRRQLLEDFKGVFEGQVLNQATEYLDEAYREVEYARIVGVESTVDLEPDQVEEEIESARATARILEGYLNQFKFSDIGDETSLGSDGHSLLKTAASLSQDAMKFRQESEPDDDEVAETLVRIHEQRGIDFKELLMGYHDDGDTVDPEELLDRIQRLFTLNQIDIKITQRRGR